MNHFFKYVLIITCMITLNLNAAVYKGQREYIKQCSSCHGGGQAFVGKKRVYEWEELMEKNGKPLAKLHLELAEEKSRKESSEYFENKKFEKMTKHLEDFFKEYAKDSGNVPACN